MHDDDNWRIPADSTPGGVRAAQAVIDFVTSHNARSTGGARQVLYSPQQWAARGEEHCGDNALLIVTHDGGEHAGAFNWAYEQFEFRNALHEHLAARGLRVEQWSSWFSSIHPSFT